MSDLFDGFEPVSETRVELVGDEFFSSLEAAHARYEQVRISMADWEARRKVLGPFCLGHIDELGNIYVDVWMHPSVYTDLRKTSDMAGIRGLFEIETETAVLRKKRMGSFLFDCHLYVEKKQAPNTVLIIDRGTGEVTIIEVE